MTSKRFFVCVLLTCTSTLALADQATEPAATGASPSVGGVEDIIVTARRREENLQTVPVSVTALTRERIERYDITSIEKISAQTPQLTVGRASNGSGAQITLRGIGSSSTSIGIEQSVAAVVDGVYYGQGRVINEGFFDLQAVEVLKGPQALYFGKNATAGVISIRTANPTENPELTARLGYELTAEQLIGELIGSTPLTDTLGLRIAVRGSNMFGGYFNNRGQDVNYNTLDIATGVTTPHPTRAYDRDEPGEKEVLGRITLQWKPTTDLAFTLKASETYSKNDNNSWNYVPFACVNGTYQLNSSIKCERKFNVYQNYFPDGIAGNLPFTPSDGSLFNEYFSYAITGTVDYNVNDIAITFINNYNRNINRWGCYCTFVSTNLAAAPSSERSVFDAFSSELRAQTQFDGPLNVMAGLYYQSTKRDHTQAGQFANLEDSSQPADLRYLAYKKRSETEGETISGYGQVSWKILPTLEATGGVRYTHETKKSYIVQPYVIAPLRGIFLQGSQIDGDQTFDNWSPEATLSWRPTRDITLYGAYKTAYKSGGFSNSGFVSATTIPSDLAFSPETANGFEVGVKTTLLDRQLRLNASAYSYKYNDLQVDFFNSQTFAFITTNAGAARTKGFELEFEYAPRALEGLNLHGTLNYNDSHYENYIAPCYGGQTIALGCDTTFQGAPGQDLSGAKTAVAPEWTGSLGATYETQSGAIRFGGSVDARFSDGYLASGFGSPLSEQPSFTTLDATLRARTENDRFEVALIGKNLTNEFIIGGVVDAPNTVGDQIGFANLPRTVQIQFTTRF